jgi:tRNA threonylcarbamoyladenosine biosynthesis protein TsaE
MQVGHDLVGGLGPASVVALIGGLGAGKTTLTKGIARGLQIEEPVTSPTFTLISTYGEGRLPLHHVDLYRLDNTAEIEDLGLEELMSADGVTIVEWAEKAQDILPEHTITVRFEIDGDSRVIRVEGFEG